MLIVFSGLPGTGKSTLARQLAQHWRAVYLRVDTVEAALMNAGHTGITIEGYAVEHRRRVEARWEDPEQHAGKWSPPDWDSVQESVRNYESWQTPRLVLDTSAGTPRDNLTALLALLAGPPIL